MKPPADTRVERSNALDRSLHERDGAIALRSDWRNFADRLCAFARVAVRTSAPSCRLASIGTFAQPRLINQFLSFDGPEIVLHADCGAWRRAFAIDSTDREAGRRGVVVVDSAGIEILAIEMIDGSNSGVLDAWRDVFAEDPPTQQQRAPANFNGAMPCATVEELTNEWAWSQHADTLNHLLWRHGLCHKRVLRHQLEARARRVHHGSVLRILHESAERSHRLCVTAGSAATTLSATICGRPNHVGGWLHVSDHGAALQLRASGIAEVWIVRGRRRTLELFDGGGAPLLILSDSGRRDSETWNSLLQAVDAT